MKALFALAFFALVAPQTTFAYPLPKPGMTIQQLPGNFTANYDFEGIVGLSNCSGSLVRFEHSTDTDKAMVLTNGHCLEFGFPKPGTFVYGRASSRTFSLLNPRGQSVGQATARKIMYSTMTGTDMTLYELRETFGEIYTRFNIRPLTMSSQHPSVNDPIEVISGYWKRGFTCAIEKFVHQLREDSYTNTDSIRYSRPGCETYGGTSGSPVILAGSRTVIGVNNTGNEDGQKCSMNNPCEIDEKGNISYQQGYSYGQQTYWVYSCLNSNKELDLNTPGCMLLH